MALFKIFKGPGTFTDLNTKRPLTVEGYCYFTPQDGKFYIDVIDDNNIDNNPSLDPRKRVVLNAGHADYASFYANGKVGDEPRPIYINNLGQPQECGDILNVSISQGLTDASGKSITVGSNQLPVYFSEGRPVACDTTLGVNISGNAATANLSNEAQHALEADEATISAGAYYLRDAQGSLAIGGPNEPVYFVNGVPTKCNSLKLPQKGDSDTPIYIDANGAPQTCTDFLPLSAGINKKISGSLGLTSEVNYGTSFPLTDNFEGKLFFIEGEEEDDMLYLPPGGSSGQVLIKYSSTDGDAYWGNLSSDYLSLNGGTLTGNLTAPCYITKNYGYDDPNTSGAKTAEGKPIQGAGINGALYFKIIS